MGRQIFMRLTNDNANSWVHQFAMYDKEGTDKSAHSLTFLKERRICTFVWLVSLATKEEVTKQTLHQDSRQLKLKSEQNQQAVERRTCAESKWCYPLIQACQIRPQAGRADRTITHCRERLQQSRCRQSLLLAVSPNPEWVVQVFIGFATLFPLCLEDLGFPPSKWC